MMEAIDPKSSFVSLLNTITSSTRLRNSGRRNSSSDFSVRAASEAAGSEVNPSEDCCEFDEPLLRELADMTGGRYYRAADAKGMAQAMDEINKLEKTSVEQPVVVNWRELYPYFCWFGLGMILLGFCLRQTVCLRLP